MKHRILCRILAFICALSLSLEVTAGAVDLVSDAASEEVPSKEEISSVIQEEDGSKLPPPEEILGEIDTETVVPSEEEAEEVEAEATAVSTSTKGSADTAATLTEYMDALKSSVHSAAYNTQLNAPFSKAAAGIRESISPETGALVVENEIFRMPGCNGADFTLRLVYNSQQAKQYDEATGSSAYTLSSATTADAYFNQFNADGYYTGTTVTPFAAGKTIQDYKDSNGTYTFTGYYITSQGSVMLASGAKNATRAKSPLDAGQDLLGLGWRIDIPHLNVDGNNIYVTMKDRQVYEVNFDLANGLKDYELSDAVFSKDAGIQVGDYTSAYRLRYADGTETYYTETGELLLQKDRHGNYIQYLYEDLDGARVIAEISNHAGNSIRFQYLSRSTIIWYNGLQYTLQKETRSGASLLAAYIDPEGRRTEYQYDIQNADFDILGIDPAQNRYANLSRVTYETGLSTVYQYTGAKKNLANGSMEYFKVSKRWDDDAAQTNLQTFFYDGEPDGYPKYKEDTIPDNYTYSTSVTTNGEISRRYTYNQKHQLIETVTAADGEAERSIIQYSLTTNLPVYEARFVDCGGTFILSEASTYAYDLYGNVIASNAPPSPGLLDSEEYMVRSAYDMRYNQPLWTSYKQDADTTVQIIYELSDDGKNIIGETHYENGQAIARTTYAYDGYGNQTRIARWIYDALWAVEERTYEDGLYMTEATLSGIETADGGQSSSTTRYTYDTATGLVLTQTDGNGNTTSYRYDTLGRVLQETLPDGAVRSYKYSDKENSITAIDAEGGTLRYEYTLSGLTESVVNGHTRQPLLTYAYDRSERLVSETDANGVETRYVYDGWGRLTEKTVHSAQGALASRQTLAYENLVEEGGVVLKVTVTTRDETGLREISQYYDAGERLLRTTRGDETAFYEYDYLGNLISQRGYDGAFTTTNYDSLGRVRSVTDPLGRTVQYTCDGLGNQTSYTDALGQVFRTRYNALGLLIVSETPLKNRETATERYWYDAVGHLTRVQDAEGGEIHYRYDARGNLLESSQPISPAEHFTTSYTYDREDRLLTSATDEAVTRYAYDPLGNLVEETDALGRSSTYAYDPLGNLTATIDRNGVETTFAYDALYREIERYNSKDGRESGTATSYSMSGLLLETANREEGYTYRYDDFGRVIEISNASGLKKVYTYDKGDRVTSLKVYQGSVQEMGLAYEYDAAGQLTAVISDGVRTTYAYDAAGRLIEETNGLTGLKTQYYYTPAGQLAAEFVFGAEGAVKCYAYEYDRNGNQTLKAEGTEETRYYYDAIGRLETAELPDGRTQHFSYDTRGNRTEMAEILDGYIKVTTYAYDLNNRLLYSENDTELCRYEYDAQGNQTRRIIQDTAFGSVAETEFIWNGDNMLAYSIDPSGQLSSYAYGPDGLRVRKTVGDATTRFFYEGGNILLELDGSHRITAKTTRGIRLISRATLTTEYGYLLDGHGDVAALVNPAGELVLDYAYDPFGSETGYQPDNADTWDNPFRYCGEYWDEETETYYLRARQYDPETGRFLSEDTHWNPGNMLYGDHPRQLSRSIYTPNMLAIKQGSNAYVYCVNDPLKYMDVSGNAVVWVFLATYGYAVVSSPDFQFDLEMLAFDLSQGDYVSAAFDAVDILVLGLSGSKAIPKVVSSFDDVGDAAKVINKVKKTSSFGFRNKLMKLTGLTEAPGLEAHHVLPRKFIDDFREIGIDINLPQYGAWVDKTEHRKWSYKYNKEWKEFLSLPTNRTEKKVMQQAELMAEKYGFETNFHLGGVE